MSSACNAKGCETSNIKHVMHSHLHMILAMYNECSLSKTAELCVTNFVTQTHPHPKNPPTKR